jgi:DMSO reductase anchor subunit
MFEKQIHTFQEGMMIMAGVLLVATIGFLIIGPPILMMVAVDNNLLPNTIVAGVLFVWLLGFIYGIGVLQR